MYCVLLIIGKVEPHLELVHRCFKKYTVFDGRASRAEYWYFSLVNALISVLLSFVDFSLGYIHLSSGIGLLSGVYTLAVMLPVTGVTIRRLHDINRSGWWVVIALI
ncbi:MAG TPA: hypothetical protein DCY55_08375, partial [Gammaproteobacteria bacterium]|nr:hypothetical protein [Gammaproteobacteria bacterium]